MQNLSNVDLENINQLLLQGLYLKALESIEKFEKIEDLSLENQGPCYLLKSNIYFEIGRYNDALKLAEQACSISQKLGNRLLLLDSYISKAWVLFELKNLDTITNLLSQGKELLEELTLSQSDYAKRDSILKLIESYLFFVKNHNIQKALEYGEASLKTSEQHNSYKEIASSLYFNSWYYYTIGNLDRAIEYLERCLKVQRTYRKRDDWRTIKDLGVLNGVIGELDLALEYTNHSLAIAEEIGNKDYIGQCLNNSSLIYRQKGKLDHAIEALERSLIIWEDLDNKMKLIGGLDSLFIVSLDANSLKQAEKYFLLMQKISKQVKHKIIDLACRVNKALLLKTSLNPLDRGQAKEILQQVIQEEIIS